MADVSRSSAPPQQKRSLSPDEGEIIVDEVKRRRASPVTSGRHNGDTRQHRVVYEREPYDRGRYDRDRSRDRDKEGYRGRRHEDSRGYRERDRRYEHPSRHSDRTEYHYDQHHDRSNHRQHSPPPRARSISSERPRHPSQPKERTPSSMSPSSRNTRSPSPHPKTVQFTSETKPPSYDKGPTQDTQELVLKPEIDEEALIEARRRKREAILAKYQGQSTPSLVDNLKIQSQEGTPVPGSPFTRLGIPSPPSSSNASDSPRPPPSREFTPDFQQGDEKVFDFVEAQKRVETVAQEGPSAADYDPTDDMKLDDVRKHQHEPVPQLGAADYDETKPAADQDVQIPEKTPPMEAQHPASALAEEDEDDMFATPVSPKTRHKAPRDAANKPVPVIAARQLDASLLDIWHDAEGYYLVTLGELLNNRYVVQANLGKGMFSSVVRCIDNQEPGKLVAIKILRNNDAMRKAGLKEISTLQKLMEADPEGRKHVIRFEGSFDHKGHLCLVFENLSLNLREVLKRFGRDVGINLKAVRAYAQQMFVGLSLLRKCNFIHADLKPDNILINENRTTLKLCDLGSASDITEQQIGDYLVSRFYRAPEIILGVHHDYAIDVWSIGCTLFELYTGKILFPGRTNNQMLRLMIECRGRFPTKLLRRGQYTSMHFNENLVFMSQEIDSVTGKEVVKPYNIQRPVKELKARVMSGSSAGVSDAEIVLLNSFVDFLGRCLELNPEKRITPSEAFRHPFIKI